MRMVTTLVALSQLIGGPLCSLGCAGAPTEMRRGTRVGFYVTTTGTSAGNGSASRPWDLKTGLSGGRGAVQPGDTLWLRGGTYVAPFTSLLVGTTAAPIVVRPYPAERVVIDGAGVSSGGEILTIDGANAVFRDFEIMNSSPDRTATRHSGVYLRHATNVKLINLVIHDTGMGVFAEPETKGCEIYGLIIYNGGWQIATRANGHGLYLKQDPSGSKLIQDNVVFNMFGLGIHAYTDAGMGQLKNMTFRGNVVFNSGTLSDYHNSNILVGGQEVANNIVVDSNMTYFAPGAPSVMYNMRIGFQGLLNGAITVTNNYVVNGGPLIEMRYWTSGTIDGNMLTGPGTVVQFQDSAPGHYTWGFNQYFRDPSAAAWEFRGTSYPLASWISASGLGLTDVANIGVPLPKVFVRPNKYEAGRANVIVYNWAGLGSVSVDVSGVLNSGDRFEVHNVQDLRGTPVASGTYAGGTIAIPMGGVAPPTPIGGPIPHAPTRTGPGFDVFLLRRTF